MEFFKQLHIKIALCLLVLISITLAIASLSNSLFTAFCISLLLVFFCSQLIAGWLTPIAKRIREEVESEVAFSLQSFQNYKVSLEEFSNQLNEKRLKLQSSVDETSRINNRFSGDLDEILQQLSSINRSLDLQSNNVEKMSHSLGAMSTSIKSVASNAETAVTTSKASEEDAKKGGEVVNKIIKHMNKITQTVSKSAMVIRELGKRSDEIGDIINVIDDIADQTELLALNAAIEAARAGAQGRGFAVVADQVRSLAEKTTLATKEISGTLSSIQEETSRAVSAMDEGLREIDSGAGFAVQAGVSLRKIVAGAKRVTEMISEIAESAEKQSNETASTTDLVTEVHSGTHRTFRESESALNSSVELATKLKKLSHLIEHFLVIWSDSHLEHSLITYGKATNKEIIRRVKRLEKICESSEVAV